jgi:hypothetical protein
MARKARKGPTKMVGFNLPIVTIEKFKQFYSNHMIELKFESTRDAADYLINLAIDGYNKAQKPIKK